MPNDPLFENLLAGISQIRAVDSHSHVDPEAKHLARPRDALSLF
jgi:hypothetical protein